MFPFDSISVNRAKLFVSVPNFIEIYNGIKKTDKDQTLLFEENKLSFEDKNLFNQQVTEWSSEKLLKNELEVIGFYFSSHPISLYPKNYLREKMIIDFEDIITDNEIKKAKVVGSILDVKERSNKDGRKYAFLTISSSKSQFELSIFDSKLNEYRQLIKEGSVLIFHIDIYINS